MDNTSSGVNIPVASTPQLIGPTNYHLMVNYYNLVYYGDYHPSVQRRY